MMIDPKNTPLFSKKCVIWAKKWNKKQAFDGIHSLKPTVTLYDNGNICYLAYLTNIAIDLHCLSFIFPTF